MGYFRKNIDKLEGYVPGFQPEDSDVVKLNTNENPYPPSPAVMQSLAALDGEDLRRYPAPLGDSFRKAAASVLNLKPENIICTNGGDDLLTICFRAFCDEKRAVAYPVPTYSLYPVLAEMQNCPAVEIDSQTENLIEKLIQADAALTIICRPNAPTATCLAKEDVEKLATGLKGMLLIDEAYVDFAEDNCTDLISKFDNAIILRSMSKGYSLAGLRFGFGIANKEIISGLMKVKDSYNVDAVAVRAATAAIEDQEYFKANVEKIKSERQRLTQALRETGFKVNDSRANFILAECNNCNADTLYEQLTRQKIFVRYWNVPGLEDKLRITIGTKEQNDKLLEAINQIIQ